jgi:hypothetical protein
MYLFSKESRRATTPIAIIACTLASLFLVKYFAKHTTTSNEAMQSELNEQHDRFELQLELASKAVVEFQKRALVAEAGFLQEQATDNRRAADLLANQEALRATEKGLLEVQNALRQSQVALGNFVESEKLNRLELDKARKQIDELQHLLDQARAQLSPKSK